MSRKENGIFLNIQSFCSVSFVLCCLSTVLGRYPLMRNTLRPMIGGPFRPFSFETFFADRAIYINVRTLLLRAKHSDAQYYIATMIPNGCPAVT